jgi:hypothetical protein
VVAPRATTLPAANVAIAFSAASDMLMFSAGSGEIVGLISSL